MNKKVGERIKELRSKVGWTQAELADRSGFTPQTVSNWESGSREPDIDTLIKLSSLFNVSLDYLLSGKEQEEKVVIMSRIEMAAKKDDPSIIQDLGWSTNYTKDENGKCIMDYVMQYKSKKIFEVMLNSCSHQSHYDVLFNCAYFSKYQNRNLKVIEFLLPFGKELEFAKAYGLGEIRLLNEFTPAFINQRAYGAKAKDELLETYKSIFKYLTDNYGKLTDSRRDYYFASNQEKANRKNCWSYAFPYFVDFALKDGNTALFNELIKKMEAGFEEFKTRAEEMRRQGYNEHQIYRDNQYMFLERPLEESYQYAIQNGLFNEARTINGLLEKAHPEKEIRLAEMKSSSDVKIKDRLIYEFTRDYLLDYRAMLNSDTVVVKGPSKEEDKDKYLENLLKQYKETYKEVLSESSVSYLELAYRGVASKNLKMLYRFAVDNGWGELEHLIVNGDTDNLLSLLRKYMILKGEEISEQDFYDGNIHRRGKGIATRVFQNNRTREEDEIGFHLDSDFKKKLDKWYEKGLLFVDQDVPVKVADAIKFFDKVKDDIVSKWAEDIENNIQSLKTRKKNEAEYNRIKAEITSEYLTSLIKKGDEEKATIKLCVRLESILKYKFHYEGDLFTMLDSFFGNQLAFVEAYKPYDDYDNNYRYDMEKYEKQMELNRVHEEWTKYLSKLRMRRNSIVHSEKNDVDFSTDDLIRCINIVESIDKGE